MFLCPLLSDVNHAVVAIEAISAVNASEEFLIPAESLHNAICYVLEALRADLDKIEIEVRKTATKAAR